MEIQEIIRDKRDGKKLTSEQIDFFVKGSSNGEIPDYQITALLMAMFLKGLDKEETFELTRAMKDSGENLDLSGIKGVKVDKHSTGGVGDKTTLITAPLAAACGVPVAKMSGRGLGFTGGTIDKLESIPGMQAAVDNDAFIKNVNEHGLCVTGQTAKVAVADKKFYALRDVTATVDNISLISSSIMSKKLALGSDAILLDVKCGKAAFMKTEEQAAALGQMMVDIGKAFGKKTVAVISTMDQPLGRAVGNSLEVIEAIDTLKGNGPEDITELSVVLAGIMICLSGLADDYDEGVKMARARLEDGTGLDKLNEMIAAQGGDCSVTSDISLLPVGKYEKKIVCKHNGYVNEIDGQLIGSASMHSGAGRQVAGQKIDPGAGIMLARKTGDSVRKGDILCSVYSNDESKLALAAKTAEQAFVIKEKPPEKSLLIRKIIV